MYEVVLLSEGVAADQLDIPGVSIQVLHREPGGGMTVLTRMQPGAEIPEHWHTRADETVFVLEGDFVEAGLEHRKGSFFAGPAGTTHGPHATVNGCLLLTRFSDTLDFNLVGSGGERERISP